MQRLRQYAVPHRHHHLDDTGNAGRRLRMADVRLHRSEPQRLVRWPVLAVGGQQRLRLDRVTQRRARTVRLDRVHVGARQAGGLERRADHPLLRRSVRGGQAVGRTILVDRGSPDESQHLVAVAPGVREPLDEQQPDALGESESVGGVAERLALAVGGQRALTAEVHQPGLCGHHRRATGERQVAFALTQRLDREVQRDQRRRARGVHRHGGPFEAQGVRDPARGHAARAAGAEIALKAFGGVPL